MGKKYTGKIKYSEESIRQLYKVTYHVYHVKRLILRMLIGAFMAAAGILLSVPTIVQVILIMAGCWLMVSKDFAARCAADDALDVRKKRSQPLPQMTTVFFDDHVELQAERSMRLDYKRFERLAEDESCFYLFLGKDSVCMIEKDSLYPQGAEEFRQFVADRTQKEWQEIKSWLFMSLYEIIKMFKRSK